MSSKVVALMMTAFNQIFKQFGEWLKVDWGEGAEKAAFSEGSCLARRVFGFEEGSAARRTGNTSWA
jgi:hypothetical protein